MSEPFIRALFDVKVVRFEMTVRTAHIVAGCLGAAAIVAAANMHNRSKRELTAPSEQRELELPLRP